MKSHTRRELIVAVAAGSAGGLVAPLIRTVPAAAQVVASCAPETLDWDTFDVGDTFTSVLVGGTTVSLNIIPFNGVTLRPQNGTVQPEPWGGNNGQYLRLDMVPAQQFDGQFLTLTFSQPVVNFTLPLYDIDNQSGAWGDRIVPTGVFTYNIPATSTLTGTGTFGPFPFDAFRNTSTTNVPATQIAGNMSIMWAGPVTSVSIYYFNQQFTGGVNQAIGIGDLTFQPCPPAAAAGAFGARAQPAIDGPPVLPPELADAAGRAAADPVAPTPADGGLVDD